MGFDKDLDVETGAWELVFEDQSTTKATLDKYSRRVGDADGYYSGWCNGATAWPPRVAASHPGAPVRQGR